VPVPFIGPEAMEQRRSGSNRRWLGGASRHNGFGFDSAPQGRETMGQSREREWTCRGGDPAAGGMWHGRHWGNGWNQWWWQPDDRRRKSVGERTGIRPKAECAGRTGLKRKLGQR
jgi:hypothetical protein